MHTNSFYSDIPTRSIHQRICGKNGRGHPKNAVIVNFSEDEIATEGDVRRELSKHGKIRAIIMCTLDACQAYVTFHDEFEKRKTKNKKTLRSARRCVKRLLSVTDGFLFVNECIWTLCRPEDWKKFMDDVTPTPTETRGTVTVNELTEIYTDFLRQNSSVSQTSIFTNSTQSFSSISFSTSSTSSIARSCDSTATVTPFSIYPARQSSGFISLPPPYHTLPDTAFFRKTKIVPPPPTPPSTPVTSTQQIMDQYISSFFNDEFPLCRRRASSSSSSGLPLDLKCSWWNPI